MAQDIFAPKSSFDIGYERPVAQPVGDERGRTRGEFEAMANNAQAAQIRAQTQVDRAKFGIGSALLDGIGGFASSFAPTSAERAAKATSGVASDWLTKMQAAQALREQGKTNDATLIERAATKGAVASGLDLDKYKTEYEAITGRQMDYIGQTPEQQAFEMLKNDQNFQAAYFAARGKLGPQASEDQLVATAMTSIQRQAIATDTLNLVAAGNKLDWENQTKGAYITLLDTFDDSVVADLVARTSQGTPITPGEISTVLMQHNLMSQKLVKPAYVSDEQWGVIQDRLTLQKDFLISLRDARDPDNLVADVVSQMMQSAENPEDVMAIAAAADPSTFAALMGSNIPVIVEAVSKTAFVDNNFNNRGAILNTLQAVDVTTPVNGNTTFTLDTAPDFFDSYKNLDPAQQLRNFRSGRVFLDTVTPNSVQTDAGRRQFYNATMSVVAGMMDDKRFYSSSEISGVFNNRNIVDTIKMLDSVDRDSADEIRVALRSVTNMQRTALQSNLDSLELNMRAAGYDTGLVWDEGDKKYYITDPQAMRHYNQLMGSEGVSDKGLYIDPNTSMATSVPGLKEAYDRRKGIVILARAFDNLAIEGVDVDTQLGQQTPGSANAANAPTQILDFISSGEGGYGASNRGTIGNSIVGTTLDNTVRNGKELTEMTLGEILDYQKIEDPNDPNRLFAVGAYQFTPGTLEIAMRAVGATENTVFSPAVQDQLGLGLLLGSKRPKLAAFIKGESEDIDSAMLEFAKEWASAPDPRTGNSYYGRGNKAKHTVEDTRQALLGARQAYASGVITTDLEPAGSTPMRQLVSNAEAAISNAEAPRTGTAQTMTSAFGNANPRPTDERLAAAWDTLYGGTHDPETGQLIRGE
jgi:hypothetical protein